MPVIEDAIDLDIRRESAQQKLAAYEKKQPWREEI